MLRTILPAGLTLTAVAAASLWAALAAPAGPFTHLLVLGAAAAAYMALNIGANDVANNMGPTVGAKALKMGTALLVAAVFDLAGAIFAGRNVIGTVSHDLLAGDTSLSGQTLILVMIAATLAGALWINASTLLGTPVSTSHAIVGGVVGAGIAAAGAGAVNWPVIAMIAVSWTLSPLLGGVLAAALHAFIRRRITRRPDKLGAARLWVPVLNGAMAGTFAMYLHSLESLAPASTLALGVGVALLTWVLSIPWVRWRSGKLENRKKQVARLFRPPLIGAAALLSFAHGANDVANAIAPFVTIWSLAHTMAGSGSSVTPIGVVALGGAGIALGIVLFGPRVIHTIGEQITKLNEIRAFCVALAAAITLLAASAFGLPISSTHVAVGAVFGVGFLREYLALRNMNEAAVPIRWGFADAPLLNDTAEQAVARERRSERRYLVRRLKVWRIGAAWLVTLPASAALAAVLFIILSWAAG